jgi:hypothetical protein
VILSSFRNPHRLKAVFLRVIGRTFQATKISFYRNKGERQSIEVLSIRGPLTVWVANKVKVSFSFKALNSSLHLCSQTQAMKSSGDGG